MATIFDRPVTTEAAGATRAAMKPTHLFVCAECRDAQLFAVQPRALCMRRGARDEGKVVFAGQPACAEMVSRLGGEVELAWCSPGPKRAPSHIPGHVAHAA